MHTILADVEGRSAAIPDAEAAAVATAAPKRRREFASGRNAARKLLAEIGHECDAIPASPERYPVWPDGVCGSISHTDSRVLVAIGSTSDHRSLGIDIEEAGAVEDDLFKSLFTTDEIGLLREANDSDLATRIFSCKESVYKAIYPLHHEFLDFRDVEVTIRGDRFSCRCIKRCASSESIDRGAGYIEHVPSHVVSLFLV